MGDRIYPHEGMDSSIKRLARHWTDAGPFDGIVGFSQGAAVGAAIAMGVLKGDGRFDAFASTMRVLVAFSGWAVKGGAYAELFTTPSSHVPRPLSIYISAGAHRKDGGRRKSEELIELFMSAKVPAQVTCDWHDGAHIIPRPTPKLQQLLTKVVTPLVSKSNS